MQKVMKGGRKSTSSGGKIEKGRGLIKTVEGEKKEEDPLGWKEKGDLTSLFYRYDPGKEGTLLGGGRGKKVTIPNRGDRKDIPSRRIDKCLGGSYFVRRRQRRKRGGRISLTRLGGEEKKGRGKRLPG